MSRLLTERFYVTRIARGQYVVHDRQQQRAISAPVPKGGALRDLERLARCYRPGACFCVACDHEHPANHP